MRVRKGIGLAALAVAAIGLAAPPALGDGTFSFGKPVPKANGTAVLPVTFSQAGKAELSDAEEVQPCGGPPRIKPLEVTVQQPGTLRLAVRPDPLIKPDLRQGRRVKVQVAVQFTPAGVNVNAPETRFKRVVLRVESKQRSLSGPACSSPNRR